MDNFSLHTQKTANGNQTNMSQRPNRLHLYLFLRQRNDWIACGPSREENSSLVFWTNRGNVNKFTYCSFRRFEARENKPLVPTQLWFICYIFQAYDESFAHCPWSWLVWSPSSFDLYIYFGYTYVQWQSQEFCLEAKVK